MQHGFVMFRYSLEDARHVKRAIELFRDKQLYFLRFGSHESGTLHRIHCLGYGVQQRHTLPWRSTGCSTFNTRNQEITDIVY